LRRRRANEHWQPRPWGWIGRPDAQPLLAEGLKDPNADVRANSATAILRIAIRPKVYTRSGELIR